MGLSGTGTGMIVSNPSATYEAVTMNYTTLQMMVADDLASSIIKGNTSIIINKCAFTIEFNTTPICYALLNETAE